MATTPRDDLALVEGYHSPQLEVDVRLNTNESPYPPPAEWRDAFLAELAGLDYHRYPDRAAAELRAGLAELHGVRPEQIFCANGSNEVLQCLCLAYGGAGRQALVFEPTYALHSHIARITGTEVVVGERADDFTLDVDDAARALRRARPSITFLCSPNNPTAMIESSAVIDAVRLEAPGFVVVDEAYGQFSPSSAVETVADDGTLVVARTFSKTWSLAAMRLGYCVAPVSVVADLEKVSLPYHLDAAKQVAGRLALRFRDAMETRVGALVAERERVSAALADLDVDVWPSSANFILFRPRRRRGAEVWQALLDRSVLVRNCDTWPRLAGCLRVTVGTPDEDDAFLSALQEVLA